MKGPLNKGYLLHKGNAKSLASVDFLDLKNHSITNIESSLFNKLTNLKTLDLSGNQLKTLPEDFQLSCLSVLDCCDNELQSIQFVRRFKRLKELYVEGNKLNDEDHYVAKLLCPSLKFTDGGDDMARIKSGLDLYRSQLTSPIEAVWEAKFAEVYSKRISSEEIDALHTELVNTVRRAAVVGSNLTMHRLREAMIEHLCRELLVSINQGTYKQRRRQKTDKYGTRVSKGVTPVKDYKEMDTGEKRSPEKKTGSAKKESQSTKKRKRESTPTSSPAAKRQRQGDEVVAFSPIKVTEGNKTQLPRVDNFEPAMFMRCHSKNNDPADKETKVWKCAFEPKPGTKGETTNIVATCGGKIVCFIDCQTTKVMRRYKDTSETESFYALAWTTLRADGENLREDVNILAVAGEDCVVKLIHPKQLMMFGSLEGHKNYISSLLFHPTQPQILFSGSRDNRIIMWEIGVPDFKDSTIEWSKKAILCLSDTDAISMVVDPSLDLLVAGCEESCFAWKLKRLLQRGSKSQVSPDYEFIHPQEDNDVDDETVIDGLVMMDKHCVVSSSPEDVIEKLAYWCVTANRPVSLMTSSGEDEIVNANKPVSPMTSSGDDETVSKCVGQSCLYMWDLKAHVPREEKRRLMRVSVQPLAHLGYVPVDIDYLYPHSNSGVLCVGDDEGRLFMYNLQSVIKNKQRSSSNILSASNILDAPQLVVDKAYETKMTDLANERDKEAVINCVAMSSSQEYLAYGTDNNLVCIWKNTSRQ